MATLPTMVTAFAETDGRERKTIEYIARLIRQQGYIQNGKPGGAAPQMATRDAANILIALNGCDTPAEAPLAIDRFRSLRRLSQGRPQGEDGPEVLQAVSASDTFGTALEVLIEGSLELAAAISRYISDAYETEEPDQIETYWALEVAGVEVEFKRYSASIRMFRNLPSGRVIDFEEIFIKDIEARPASFYGREQPLTDRRVSVTIGLTTLLVALRCICAAD